MCVLCVSDCSAYEECASVLKKVIIARESINLIFVIADGWSICMPRAGCGLLIETIHYMRRILSFKVTIGCAESTARGP